MKFIYKTWKEKIEQDLWIPAVQDVIDISILHGYPNQEMIDFLKKLKLEARKRLNKIPF